MKAFIRTAGALAGRVSLAAAIGLGAATVVAAEGGATLKVYGPGGPAPAMKAAARAFSDEHLVAVEVVAGPPPKWLPQAREDADIIYSGAEHMMTGFDREVRGLFDIREAEPLYLRPVSILVRPGNPKKISGFEDLLKPGMKVLVVAGAGQVGLWEDVAARTGDITKVQAFRRNVVFPEAGNSALAREQWRQQPDIDAWLIWNIWQVSNPDLADQVPVEERYRIYRPTSVVLTVKGKAVPEAQAFVDYLKSDKGRAIFAKWGWETGTTP